LNAAAQGGDTEKIRWKSVPVAQLKLDGKTPLAFNIYQSDKKKESNLVLILLGLWALFPLAEARDEKPPARMAYSQPFQGKPDDMQRYAFRSPNTLDYLTFEPDGLRIKLPPGYAEQRPSIGLALVSTVQGNFEITARFELLKEPDPADAGNFATRVSLGVLLDTPERNEAAVSRRMIARGKTQFFTFLLMERGATGKGQPNLHTVPTEAKTGRLRLVRTGSMISCFASEGANEDFILLKEYPFSPLDVKQVFLHASTGGPKADLDVRISDLRIVADSLPDLAASAPPAPGSKRWLAAAVILNLLLLLAAIAGWFILRQRRGGRTKPESRR